MDVTRKDATITNTDETFPGAFEVVLSTPAEDRDGDKLASEDWKQPLPDHITFDSDHGMSVATTVGSGAPSIEDGNLIVRGTYSSLPRAQEVRTLVNEGHIRTTSVAFMSSKSTKDGKSRTTRELLNGAFVAIPSNREALVMASKALDVKAGARNSMSDAGHIQAILAHAMALGATPAGPSDDTGAEDVSTAEKSYGGPDAGMLAQAVDAALDEAQNLLATVDPSTLPQPVQQALGLLTAAETTVDELLDALGVTDPDEDAAADGAAPADAGDAAKSVDAEVLALQALSVKLAAYVAV